MRWFRSKPKKKTSFRDVAPSGLFDLHSHVLPGVDDGARNLDESVAMLDALGALGFAKVAATPHFDTPSGNPSVAQQAALIAAIDEARKGRAPEVVVGAEVVFDELFVKAEAEGRVPGIATQKIYLVELGFLPGMFSPGVVERMFRFQAGDKQLIFAHPERVPDLQRDPGKAEGLKRAGVLMQLDVMSLVGRYGRIAETTAHAMLDRGIIDLASSDLHHKEDVDLLAEALQVLLDRDTGAFERLVSTHPSRVMTGRVEEIVPYA